MGTGRKGKNVGGGGGGLGNVDLDVALKLHGVDVVTEVANIIKDTGTSTRIRADLLKDLLNYRYSKQKAVEVQLSTGSGVVFNIDLTGKV
jgi:hypothetical protein